MRIAPASHLAAAAALLASSCVFVVHDHDECGPEWGTTYSRPEHQGSGAPAREVRDVAEFARVEVGGTIHLDLRVGEPRSVAVEADDNLVAHVRTEVADGVLRLSLLPGSYETRTPLRVEVVTPSLRGLVLDGAARADVAGLAGGAFDVAVGGAAEATLAGRVDVLSAHVSGAGELGAFGLEALRADVDVGGAGEAEVTVREDLSGDVSGAGKLRYRGDPQRLRTETTGSGTVNGP